MALPEQKIEVLPLSTRRSLCKNCEFRMSEGPNHFCVRMPPQLTFFMAQMQPSIMSANQAPQTQPVPVSGFPPVQLTQWCGEFRPKMDA